MTKRSIRFKLTFWYAATVGAIAVCLGLLLYVGFRNKLYREMDIFLDEEAESVVSYLDTVGEERNLQNYFKFLIREKEAVYYPNKFIQLINPVGEIIERSQTLDRTSLHITPQTRDSALRGEVVFETASLADGTPVRLVMMPVKGEEEGSAVSSVVELAIPLTESYRAMTRLGAILFLLFPVVVGISIVSGAYMAKRALRPVDEITQEARKIEVENLSRRLQVSNPKDEIGQLAEVLNSLLSHLEGAFQQMRQFTADAAHELRTPLAVLRCGMEVVAAKARSLEEYQEALGDSIEEVSRLSHVVDNLFTLARADAGSQEIEREEVNLSGLLQEIYEQAELMAEAKGLQISLHSNGEVSLQGDCLRLKQLFLNLVDNAIKYTAAGGNIRLVVEREEQWANVAVEDDGIGIPAEALSHIFDRFYRVDKARSLDTTGGGLGLSICQWIAQAHGGKITVRSRVGCGSTFIVSLLVGRSV